METVKLSKLIVNNTEVSNRQIIESEVLVIIVIVNSKFLKRHFKAKRGDTSLFTSAGFHERYIIYLTDLGPRKII